MTAAERETGVADGAADPLADVRAQVLDATVRAHFGSLHDAGVCVAWEQVSDRTKRIVADQVRDTVNRAVDAVADVLRETRQERDQRARFVQHDTRVIEDYHRLYIGAVQERDEARAALDAERAETQRLTIKLDAAEASLFVRQCKLDNALAHAERAEAAIASAHEYLRGVGESSLAHLHLAGHGEAVKAINSTVAALETETPA